MFRDAVNFKSIIKWSTYKDARQVAHLLIKYRILLRQTFHPEPSVRNLLNRKIAPPAAPLLQSSGHAYMLNYTQNRYLLTRVVSDPFCVRLYVPGTYCKMEVIGPKLISFSIFRIFGRTSRVNAKSFIRGNERAIREGVTSEPSESGRRFLAGT